MSRKVKIKYQKAFIVKKKSILVSILIINYNNEKLLVRAVKSCLNQTYKNVEILLYDDKSSDDSVREIKKFKKKIKFFINKDKKIKVPAIDAAQGYYYLFNKSKGKIICLLDSDDFFHASKVKTVVDCFKENKNINFIQNLPLIKTKKQKKIYKKNKNNFLSFWPYLAPESCISFKKEFMKNFIKDNCSLKNRFRSVWLGFRMGTYAFFLKKNFLNIDLNLTFYESLGESKKYSFLGKNWLLRRNESFEYLKKILKNKEYKMTNLDYFVTKALIKIFAIK